MPPVRRLWDRAWCGTTSGGSKVKTPFGVRRSSVVRANMAASYLGLTLVRPLHMEATWCGAPLPGLLRWWSLVLHSCTSRSVCLPNGSEVFRSPPLDPEGRRAFRGALIYQMVRPAETTCVGWLVGSTPCLHPSSEGPC